MGQYYEVIIYTIEDDKKIIKNIINPRSFGSNLKLMEHSYLNVKFMNVIELILSNKSYLYKNVNIVWKGDYSEIMFNNNEVEISELIHNQYDLGDFINENEKNLEELQYIVNHTKKVYIDKKKLKNNIHPLPLLVAHGNGQGNGDYEGNNQELCGTWIDDLISMENSLDDCEYTEFEPDFYEND